MAKKKNTTSGISSIYDSYTKAFDLVKTHLDELRLNECVEGHCEIKDLPEIDKLLVIGRDSEGMYWMFDSDAFYWSSTIELPVMFSEGHMHINPTDSDIDNLVKKKLINQYIIITDL